MNSKSPFQKASPLKVYKYASSGSYTNPATVIQPIVGAEIGQAITKVGSDLAVKAIKAKKGKDKSTEEHKREFDKLGKDAERDFKEFKEIGFGLQPSSYSISNQSGPSEEKENDTSFLRGPMMTGDPMLTSGSEIDPYANLNPQAFTDVQQQEQAQNSQIPLPSPRTMDLSAMQDPYSGPGSKFDPSARMKAESIYGSALQRQGLMNLGSPANLGGKKYNVEDLIDESDFDKLKTGHNVQNISKIQEDEKGQFMTTLGDYETFMGSSSKIIDYPRPGAIRDTIRPKRGKSFKKRY